MPQYLMPKASCKETGQTVMSNDLGKKFMITDRRSAELEANRLAEQMSAKTGRKWSGFVEAFMVDFNGRTKI